MFFRHVKVKTMEQLILWDKELFLFLNGLNNDFLDVVMYWVSDKYIWIPFYFILLVLIGQKLRWKSLLIILPMVVLLILLSDQGSVFLKNLFQRLRPCHEPSLDGLVHLVREKCGGQYGFVSSHAANTFAIAVFIGELLKRQLKWILIFMLLWAGFVSYSRIYLGVHYPADIFCGGLLGVILAYGVLKLYYYFKRT